LTSQVFLISFYNQKINNTSLLKSILIPIRLIFLFSLLITFFIILGTPSVSLSANPNSFSVSVEVFDKTGGTKNIHLYSSSQALVIGCNFYGRRWPALAGSARFADDIADTLDHLGFKVKTVKNPDGQQLQDAIHELANEEADWNRSVVIYFGGHGYTINGAGGVKSSYIVPVDAPDPDIDPVGFINKAVSLAELEQISRVIKAKHVLFIFDACFNADMLALSRPDPSPYLTETIDAPLRAFILNGDEGEQKPEQNFFKTVLVHGLKDGYADRSPKDGYITDRELAQYLQEQVSSYSYGSQFPLYGRIREPSLDKGEFVFLALKSSAAPAMIDSTPGGTRIETGSLSLTSSPEGAVVHLEGKYIGTTPMKIEDIPAGRNIIRVALQGYEAEIKEVLVRAGRDAAIRLNLNPKKPKGHLTISTTPINAMVRIVNVRAQYEPGIELEEGMYTIQVARQGYETDLREIPLAGGQDLDIEVELKRRDSPDNSDKENEKTYQTTWTEPISGMEFVLITGGCFQMGCRSITYDCEDDEIPVHNVCLNDYWLGKYEVSQQQWLKIMGENKSYFKDKGEYPVENVSWDDAQRFIDLISKQARKSFRLPTEAEWEYAARSADKQVRYAAANSVDAVAWYMGSWGKGTLPVKSGKPNGLGLYGIPGNVCEWCADWYGEDYYKKSFRINPVGPATGDYRVYRGVSWDGSPRYTRASFRYRAEPSFHDVNLGVRLALPGNTRRHQARSYQNNHK